MIETDRLVLRPWRAADRPHWLAMNAEPEVAYWLGGPPDPAQAEATFERERGSIAADGFGMWAAERKSDRALVGSIGLRRIPPEWGHPMSGQVEIGWRLRRDAWGMGLASEGAAASLAWGFDTLPVAEVIAFTAETNARSQAVMGRIGMVRAAERDFDHPTLAEGHPLRRHIVYLARRPPTLEYPSPRARNALAGRG